MNDGTIVVIIYLSVLAVFIFAAGAFKIDDLDTDDKIIACIFWPIVVFCFVVFWFFEIFYKLGERFR